MVLKAVVGLIVADEVLNDGRGFDKIQKEWDHAWEGLKDGWEEAWENMKENPMQFIVAAAVGYVTGGAGAALVGFGTTTVSSVNDGLLGDAAQFANLFYGNYQQALASAGGKATGALLVSTAIQTVSDVASKKIAEEIAEELGIDNPAVISIMASSISDGVVGAYGSYDGEFLDAVNEGIDIAVDNFGESLKDEVKNELIDKTLEELDLPEAISIALNITLKTVLDEMDSDANIRQILEDNKDQIIDDIVDELVSELAVKELLDALGLDNLPPNIKDILSDALSEGFVDYVEALYVQYNGDIEKIAETMGDDLSSGFASLSDPNTRSEALSDLNNKLQDMIENELGSSDTIAIAVVSEVVGLLKLSEFSESTIIDLLTSVIENRGEGESLRDAYENNKDDIIDAVIEGAVSSHIVGPILDAVGLDSLPANTLQSLNNVISDTLAEEAITLYNENDGDWVEIRNDILGQNDSSSSSNNNSNNDGSSAIDTAIEEGQEAFANLPQKLRDSLIEEVQDDRVVVGIVTDIVNELDLSPALSNIIITALSTTGIAAADSLDDVDQSIRQSIMESGGDVINNILYLGANAAANKILENVNISDELKSVLSNGIAPTILRPILEIANGAEIQEALVFDKSEVLSAIESAAGNYTDVVNEFIDQIILQLDSETHGDDIDALTDIKNMLEPSANGDDEFDVINTIFNGIDEYNNAIIQNVPEDIGQEISLKAVDRTYQAALDNDLDNFSLAVQVSVENLSNDTVSLLTDEYEYYLNNGVDIDQAEFSQITDILHTNQTSFKHIMNEQWSQVGDLEEQYLTAGRFIESEDLFNLLKHDFSAVQNYMNEIISRHDAGVAVAARGLKNSGRLSEKGVEALNSIREVSDYIQFLEQAVENAQNLDSEGLASSVLEINVDMDSLPTVDWGTGYQSVNLGAYLNEFEPAAREIVDAYAGINLDSLNLAQKSQLETAIALIEAHDRGDVQGIYNFQQNIDNSLINPFLEANMDVLGVSDSSEDNVTSLDQEESVDENTEVNPDDVSDHQALVENMGDASSRLDAAYQSENPEELADALVQSIVANTAMSNYHQSQDYAQDSNWVDYNQQAAENLKSKLFDLVGEDVGVSKIIAAMAINQLIDDSEALDSIVDESLPTDINIEELTQDVTDNVHSEDLVREDLVENMSDASSRLDAAYQGDDLEELANALAQSIAANKAMSNYHQSQDYAQDSSWINYNQQAAENLKSKLFDLVGEDVGVSKIIAAMATNQLIEDSEALDLIVDTTLPTEIDVEELMEVTVEIDNNEIVTHGELVQDLRDASDLLNIAYQSNNPEELIQALEEKISAELAMSDYHQSQDYAQDSGWMNYNQQTADKLKDQLDDLLNEHEIEDLTPDVVSEVAENDVAENDFDNLNDDSVSDQDINDENTHNVEIEADQETENSVDKDKVTHDLQQASAQLDMAYQSNNPYVLYDALKVKVSAELAMSDYHQSQDYSQDTSWIDYNKKTADNLQSQLDELVEQTPELNDKLTQDHPSQTPTSDSESSIAEAEEERQADLAREAEEERQADLAREAEEERQADLENEYNDIVDNLKDASKNLDAAYKSNNSKKLKDALEQKIAAELAMSDYHQSQEYSKNSNWIDHNKKTANNLQNQLNNLSDTEGETESYKEQKDEEEKDFDELVQDLKAASERLDIAYHSNNSNELNNALEQKISAELAMSDYHQSQDYSKNSSWVNYNKQTADKLQAQLNNLESPLVIDIDGDGVELLNIQNGVHFDMDQDGVVEQTGWVGADDGLLALDKNADGVINNRLELFGNTDGFSDGFENLSSYDKNNDGVIDINDDVYEDLIVWQDQNSDGVSNAGEHLSLADVGVVSIFLNAEMPDDLFVEGSWISHTSTFVTVDGSSNDIVDAWFETRELSEVEISAIEQSTDTLLSLNEIGDNALDISQMLEIADNVTDAIQDFVYNENSAENQITNQSDTIVIQDNNISVTSELDDLSNIVSEQIVI